MVGDRESANSNRLAEICRSQGKPAHLISDASGIEDAWLEGVESVLITAGASAPERLVEGVIEHLRAKGPVEIEEHQIVDEGVHFKLPRVLSESRRGE